MAGRAGRYVVGDGTPGAAANTAMGEPSRILVVDDEPGPRESLRMLLKDEYQVDTTARGSEALGLLREVGYDVVLLDLTMPQDLSGTESLRAIREASIDVEALVVTGQGSLESAIDCLRLGARDYIAKPFHGPAVLAAVRAALVARRLRQRAIEMRGNLLGNLSHEFRTPLHAIVGYSEILREEAGERLDEAHREALDRIRRCSERLLSYLEGLLFLAESESGRIAGTSSEFTVLPWLELLLAPIRNEAMLAGGRIEVDCPPGLAVHADPRGLARLMGVLAYEALARAPGTALRVRVSLLRRDELAIVLLARATGAGRTDASASTEAGSWGGSDVLERAARALDVRIERTARADAMDDAVRVRIRCSRRSLAEGTPEPGATQRLAAGRGA